jgi:hypothetical protein
MNRAAVHQKFTAAVDALVEQVKGDRSILAAILCGSLSHDTVWAKSDIDLVFVTVDDKKVEPGELAVRRRPERPRHAHSTGGVPEDCGRLRPELVHALVPDERAAPLRARSNDRGPVRDAR